LNNKSYPPVYISAFRGTGPAIRNYDSSYDSSSVYPRKPEALTNTKREIMELRKEISNLRNENMTLKRQIKFCAPLCSPDELPF